MFKLGWLGYLFSSKFLLLFALNASISASAYAQESHAAISENFAVVNGYAIPLQTYVLAMKREARKRYYHARITDERYAELKGDVSQRLIDNALLMLEAEKLGLEPDSVKVDAALMAVVKRVGTLSESEKEKLQLNVRGQLESRERIRMLEEQVRQGVKVTEVLAKQFYKDNLALFVMPAQRKVSVILIKVSPSSPAKSWADATEQLAVLRKQVQQGVSFAELAREYSHDQSAPSGGDMGFLHQGMLDDRVEAALAKLKVGELSDPIRVLEGVVLVRLEGVKSDYQKSYSSVKDRVYQLLTDKMADEAWLAYVQKLRSNAKIIRNERLPELMSR